MTPAQADHAEADGQDKEKSEKFLINGPALCRVGIKNSQIRRPEHLFEIDAVGDTGITGSHE